MSRFQGDPAVEITEKGARMKFTGGQPVMDQGLHNYVLISLFTRPGWWGNVFTTDENKKIGSNFSIPRTIVDVKTVNDYRDLAQLALRPMKSTGLASNIDVEITNPKIDSINIAIKIYPPGQDALKLLFTKNGMSWIEQALNPASERL